MSEEDKEKVYSHLRMHIAAADERSDLYRAFLQADIEYEKRVSELEKRVTELEARE